MKKLTAMLLVLTLLPALSGCGKAPLSPEPPAPPVTEAAPAQTETLPVETEPAGPVIMTFADYMAAEIDSPIILETYVQACQSWWDNTISLYCQSPDGACFLYSMRCTEEDAAKLVPGTPILVTGYKAMREQAVEILGGTFEILEGKEPFIPEAADLTSLLGSDGLIAHQNEKVIFKGLTVTSSTNPKGDSFAFLYGRDGAGEQGDDLYFSASAGDKTFLFCVESYLTGADTQVYQAVEALKIGDVIDAEGFLYWEQGPIPHITAVIPS